MFILSEVTRDPSEKWSDIRARLKNIRNLAAGITLTSSAFKLLELSTQFREFQIFLQQYKDDIDLIGWMNSEFQGKNGYPADFDAVADFTALFQAINTTKSVIAALDFTGVVGLNANGVMTWVVIDNSTVITALVDITNILSE